MRRSAFKIPQKLTSGNTEDFLNGRKVSNSERRASNDLEQLLNATAVSEKTIGGHLETVQMGIRPFGISEIL
jgi:hypothetical protein